MGDYNMRANINMALFYIPLALAMAIIGHSYELRVFLNMSAGMLVGCSICQFINMVKS